MSGRETQDEMGGLGELLSGLRRQAARTIATNALPLAQLALGRAPAPVPPERWSLAAKLGSGLRIADEEGKRAAGHHNDAGDAMRHARWSGRMAQEAGPIFSGLVGVEHELENVAGSSAENLGKGVTGGTYPPRPVPSVPQTISESMMDLHNNAEGIGAAIQGRPIDPARLQNRPVDMRTYPAAPRRP